MTLFEGCHMPSKPLTIRPDYRTRELLNELEAADYCDLDPKTLRGWRQKGRGPAFTKIGGNIRYKKVFLDSWMDRHTIKPDAAA
jgi:hypothetical protein